MTLKSLNTRYVKLIRKMAAAVVLLLVTVSLLSMTRWSAEATGFNLRPAEADNLIPALQGTAAITYFKEHKLYESLRTAYAARTQQGENSVLAPLFVNEQKLTASDGASGDKFGHSVAFSGSTVVVGAWFDDIGGNRNQGSAYVFNRQGEGWVEAQKLTASDGAASDIFGLSVAVSGPTIVVGSPANIGNLGQGSVYVFNRQDGNWVETQKLTASDGAFGDGFGWSVAVSGSTIVVGAPSKGSTYVFNRQGGSWVEAQRLTASDGAFGDGFGASVAVSGSTVVVGSPGNDTFGSTYVFNRQGGSWLEEQKLTTGQVLSSGLFGHSVAISGSTIVVCTIGDNVQRGSAHVFNRHEGSWVEEQKLTASDGRLFDLFGWSVAISDSSIVVGVPFKKTIGGNDEGAAYVFNRKGGSWVEEQKLTASDAGFGDLFGFSVAVSGSTVVVGAENSGNIDQGAAYIFER